MGGLENTEAQRFRGGGERSSAYGEKTPEPHELKYEDGVGKIEDHAAYQKLSYKGFDVMRDEYLANIEFVKFIIVGADSDNPKIYFMNTNNHRAHPPFMSRIGLSNGFGGRGGPGGFPGRSGLGTVRGALNFNPRIEAPDGSVGIYYYDFQPNDSYTFEEIQKIENALAKFMPYAKTKMAFHPLQGNVSQAIRDQAKYKEAGLTVLMDNDLYRNIAFLSLNQAVGYGRLKIMDDNVRPSARDIVLCKRLPNEMPRVGGVLSEERQTPLSHVNLRAIQDDVPNAYIKNASQLNQIKSLMGKWVKYTVRLDGYEIVPASKDEVDKHFASIRPQSSQTPKRDLAVTSIKPLSEIKFTDSSAFGVKSSNLAVLHTFKFPEGTIPDGYSIPFHYYIEFMKYNGFFNEIESMLNDQEFIKNTDAQSKRLKAFRSKIKQAPMPEWMMKDLDELHKQFPAGTSLRCRSSTNNEDLPGFSGAGLYDSYTHKPDEGHLSKSIKQVYASLWNYRAFEEREFYRISHHHTAMGVLVHPNFKDEMANGVAVTDDILYDSLSNYYVNAQVGEDLVTNPSESASTEEVLLGWWAAHGHQVVRKAETLKPDESIISDDHLKSLRFYLGDIHAGFQELYKPEGNAKFAMEIEFKITKDNKLVIKQARPWVY